MGNKKFFNIYSATGNLIGVIEAESAERALFKASIEYSLAKKPFKVEERK